MSTQPQGTSRPFPSRPNLQHLKDQAKDLLNAGSAKSITDAQFQVAHLYGFASWPKLKHFVDDINAPASAPSDLSPDVSNFIQDVRAGDAALVAAALAKEPALARTRILGDNRLEGVIYSHANPNEPSPPGAGRSSTPLHYAAVKSFTDVARVLLDAGADPNAWGYDNNHGISTPILLAAWEGSLDVLKLLLDRGADPNLYHGQTPLMTALEHGKHEHVKRLLQAGAIPTLHDAAALGLVDRLTALLTEDPSRLELRDVYRRATPLYFAACLDQPAAIDFLLDKGANIETQHSGQWTPLLAAGYYKAHHAISRLTQRGANLHAADSQGYWGVSAGSNILHFLCLHAQKSPLPTASETSTLIDLLKLLIDLGADINARTATGLTPLAIARDEGNERAASLLQSYGGIT